MKTNKLKGRTDNNIMQIDTGMLKKRIDANNRILLTTDIPKISRNAKLRL